jgi:thiamine-phosphate pyrophosphorylase
MTDERLGHRLWEAIDRLPANSGIVFRHYSLAPVERRRLAEQVVQICRNRRLKLAVAGDSDLARDLSADLIHNPAKDSADLPVSIAVHSLEQAEQAKRNGASIVFVSPVFASRSHPDREPLGSELGERIAEAGMAPAIALGGMNADRFAQLKGFHGWAGIDAWLGADGT